jgi:prepilin-type N-terminal cleavage/methylation domain-containing protein
MSFSCFSRNKRGFTLLEILIIVGILAILVAVIVPNVSTILGTGNLAAANDELRNIRTAATGYKADQANLEWPDNSDQLDQYISKDPTGFYVFNTSTGLISNASGWGGLVFNPVDQRWEKAP